MTPDQGPPQNPDGTDWSLYVPNLASATYGNAQVCRSARAQMRPVTLNGNFGWLHTRPHAGPDAAGGDVAVLLCAGLSRDALDAHQAWRLLADEFAAAGYPAMRFDYPGIGDSCDIERLGADPVEHWAAWQESVHNAADWLVGATGASRLILCGLRVGATIAANAAECRDDVAGLILLAPVLRGNSYMLQLAMEAKLQGKPRAMSGGGLEFQELHFSADTVSRFRQADLRQARLAAGCRIAVFSQSPSSLLAACSRAWAGRGADVTCHGFDGLEPMLRHDEVLAGSAADFSMVLDWLRRSVPARAAVADPDIPLAGPVLSRPGWIELPLRFGEGQRLFGMLCRPDDGSGDTAVIVCNTGRDPHYGFARFGVEFARRLASEGVASLRIDFAGLGDSIGASGRDDRLSPMFDDDRTPDIAAAVDALRPLGYRRFALQGLCAGAYHGFHGALADPRIGTLLLVNLPVFTWRRGDTVDFVGHKLAGPGRYLAKIASRDTLRRLVEGRIEVRAILLAQAAHLAARLRRGCLHLAARLGCPAPTSFARRAVAKLTRRGVGVLLLFSPGDKGIDTLEHEFGSWDLAVDALAGASLQVAPEIDHNLSERAMQRTAADIMLRFLKAGFLKAQPGSRAA